MQATTADATATNSSLLPSSSSSSTAAASSSAMAARQGHAARTSEHLTPEQAEAIVAAAEAAEALAVVAAADAAEARAREEIMRAEMEEAVRVAAAADAAEARMASAGASAARRGTASAVGLTGQKSSVIFRPAAEMRTSRQTYSAAVRQRLPPPANRDSSHCHGPGGAAGKGGGNYYVSARRGVAVVNVRKLAGHVAATATGKWAAVYDRAARDPNRIGTKPPPRQIGVFDTQHEAQMELEAVIPPVWQAVGPSSWCQECQAVIDIPEGQRSHCWNCGRVVCVSCSTFWLKSTLPLLYTEESTEHRIQVCKMCHHVSERFRAALLLGDEQDAMAAFATGCINLRGPYTTYHGELPVHCAAAGGSVTLLTWLVEDRCCPLSYTTSGMQTPLRDGRNLTVLGAAAVGKHVEAMRYLVKKQGCKVNEITHIPTLWNALEACLLGKSIEEVPQAFESAATAGGSQEGPPARTDLTTGERGRAEGTMVSAALEEDDENVTCIVCFDAQINCTLVPCGHHCCCTGCASKFSLCPVCRKRITEKIRAICV